MYDSKIPTILLPTNPPNRPNSNINEVAMPRLVVGNKFTATAMIMFTPLQQLRNNTKLMTIELNSVNKFNAKQQAADSKIQVPGLCEKAWLSSSIQIQKRIEMYNELISYKSVFSVTPSSLDSWWMPMLAGKKLQSQAIFDTIEYFCYLFFHTWNRHVEITQNNCLKQKKNSQEKKFFDTHSWRRPLVASVWQLHKAL